MPPTQPSLNEVLPPLICGTATFNSQYNTDPFAMPTNAIIARALELGITAFDTSPYYGPSESLLGTALSQPAILSSHPRQTYTLITKVGRIGPSTFDYTPSWIHTSIASSLSRLNTSYLDLVYCHDVEFVSSAEVLTAIRELRRIRDEEGTIKYIGISGYPVPLLCELAEMVLQETGEPLDAVMSYANFTLQNTTLLTLGLERLRKAGVSVVPNASPLGMGLLRSVGVPIGGGGDFHPAPQELRDRVAQAAKAVATGEKGERLETISIRWALEEWARVGGAVEGYGGISVMGVSKIEELEETMRVWSSILDGTSASSNDTTKHENQREWSIARRKEVQQKAKLVWSNLGEYKDYVWDSPEKGFVNLRGLEKVVESVVEEAKVVVVQVEGEKGVVVEEVKLVGEVALEDRVPERVVKDSRL